MLFFWFSQEQLGRGQAQAAPPSPQARMALAGNSEGALPHTPERQEGADPMQGGCWDQRTHVTGKGWEQL